MANLQTILSSPYQHNFFRPSGKSDQIRSYCSFLAIKVERLCRRINIQSRRRTGWLYQSIFAFSLRFRVAIAPSFIVVSPITAPPLFNALLQIGIPRLFFISAVRIAVPLVIAVLLRVFIPILRVAPLPLFNVV